MGAFLEGVFDTVADGVAGFDGDAAVDGDVEVDDVAHAVLADEAFVDAQHVGDGRGDGSDGALELFGAGGIHEFINGAAEEAEAVVCDDAAGKECGPVISGGIAFAADESDGDADGSGGGGEGVGVVMPGVALEGGAFDVLCGAKDEAGEGGFDDDHENEDREGEPGGHVMGREDFLDALDRDHAGGTEKRERDDEGGDRFRLAVAVGMFAVGGDDGDAQAAPDDEGGEDIGGGLDAVGDEGVGIADDAGGDLDNGECDIDSDAGEGGMTSARSGVGNRRTRC